MKVLLLGTVTIITFVMNSGDLLAAPSPEFPSNSTSVTNSNTKNTLTAQTPDDLSSRITIAALGGFMGWVLTTSVGLIILRARLISYLIVVINTHLKNYYDSIAWIEAVKDQTIKDGHLIKLAASYTKDELSDLTGVRNQCLKLLTKNELLQVTKLIQRMLEVEALMAGFCESLHAYKQKEIVLDASDVDYLIKKKSRILSYLKLLPLSIDKITDLPIDYSGIHGPEVLVTSASAALPALQTKPQQP